MQVPAARAKVMQNTKLDVHTGGGAALHSTMDTVLASQPSAQGSILGYLKNFSRDVAEIFLLHCLE